MAKTLVNENPALAAPEHKDTLLSQIRGCASVMVHFNESEIATIEALVDRQNRPGEGL